MSDCLKGDWKKQDGFERAELSSPHQDEQQPITVTAYRFQGDSTEVALAFAVVHGSEPQGVTIANELLVELKNAVHRGKRPRLTAIVIPELIGRGRFIDPKTGNPDRYVRGPLCTEKKARIKGKETTTIVIEG